MDKTSTRRYLKGMQQVSNGRPIVIVGGGIGGLVAAIDLARQGEGVVIFERAASLGGKMRRLEVGGRSLDVGPTVLTRPFVFEGLFADAGFRLSDHVVLQKAEVLARHGWADGSRLDLFANQERSRDAIAALAGRKEADGFVEYCNYARAMMQTVEEPFLLGERPSLGSVMAYVGKAGPRSMLRIDPYRSMMRAIKSFFRDPRLVQLFGRYATYCGSSPFLAPATLNVVAHVEQEGVYYVRGGMHRLVEAMALVAERLGVQIRCGTAVESIRVGSGGAAGVRLANGEEVDAKAVVMNGDTEALAAGLLGADCRRAVAPRSEASLSAVTVARLGRAQGFPLVRHNVFFARNTETEFRELFENGKVPTDPTVYVCAQDREDDGLPAGLDPDRERFFLIVNAPAQGAHGEPPTQEKQRWITQISATLARSGLSLDGPSDEAILATPSTYHQLFPGTGGALYGAATHGWRAPFQRPSSRTKVPGLYLAGGSVHPGAGVPMVATSGRIAARTLLSDLASSMRSSRTVTAGGT